MRAFIDTLATKDELLRSLIRHVEHDRIAAGTGKYWSPAGDFGCFVGCSLHDFAPGHEDQPRLFEAWFGIPREVVLAAESIFESIEPRAAAPVFALRFVAAIPEGASIDPDDLLMAAYAGSHAPACGGIIFHDYAWRSRSEAVIRYLIRLPGLLALPPGRPVADDPATDAWSPEREIAGELTAVGAD